MTIKETIKRYSTKLDYLDIELILSRILCRSREFILTHPEFIIPTTHNQQLTTFIKRRAKGEPLAYILGHKEFYGLNFKVNKDVLIPRPETELLVDLTLKRIQDTKYKIPNAIIVDVGTGSGNAIISIVKSLLNHKLPTTKYRFFGTDISRKALAIAKQNAKRHKVDKKIKFLEGNLLNPLIKRLSVINSRWSVIILANLPYLSPAIYRSSQISVQMYEPKKALFGGKLGLLYYKRLFRQISKILGNGYRVTVIFEFSPEQKPALESLIKKILSKTYIKFHKDLSGKWRVCEIKKFETRNKFE